MPRVQRDEGAITAEYVAVLTLVAATIPALLLSGIDTTVAEAARRAICQIVQVEPCDDIARPGTPEDPLPPEELNRLGLPCLAGRNTLDLRGSLLISGIQGDLGYGYVIDRVGTGTFRVTFYLQEALGAGVKSGADPGTLGSDGRWKTGKFGNASITVGGRGGVSYDFETREEAEAFAHDVREWLRIRPQPVQMVLEQLGPGGELASAGVGLLGQGVNWLVDRVLRRPPEPDVSFTHATASLRAEAEGGWYGATTPGASGSGGGGSSGVLSEIHLEGPANGWTIFTGEAELEGDVGGSSLVASIGIGGGRALRYRVIWDAQDEPLRLTLIQESTTNRLRAGINLGGEGRSGTGAGGAVSERGADISITEWNLDLRDSDARAAFHRAFLSVPGRFAVPYAALPGPPPVASWGDLMGQVAEDGVMVGLEYREQVPTVEGGGGGRGVTGIEGSLELVDRELVSATIVDQHWEDPAPRQWETCFNDEEVYGPPGGGGDIGG